MMRPSRSARDLRLRSQASQDSLPPVPPMPYFAQAPTRMTNPSHPRHGRDDPFTGPNVGYENDVNQSATYHQTGRSPPERIPPSIPRGPPFNHRGVAQEFPVPPQNPAGPAGYFLRSRAGAVHPLGMNPPMVSAPSSMPLTQLTQTSEMRPSVANIRNVLDPEEINRKVQQMIEATEALKGKPNTAGSRPAIPSSSTTSKLLSGPKGMLKRVSSVLNDRFLSRSNAKDGPAKEASKSGLRHVLEEQESPIAPIEMRLNEGTNLGNPKVQRMVGGTHVKRKPVPDGGMSLRQQMPTEEEVYEEESSEEFIPHEEMRPKSSGQQIRANDPFSVSPTFQRRPTNFEDRLRARSGGGTMPESLHSRNPFSTERVLGSDYGAPLDLTPGCASTPRVPGVRPPHWAIESPTRAPRRGGQEWI